MIVIEGGMKPTGIPVSDLKHNVWYEISSTPNTNEHQLGSLVYKTINPITGYGILPDILTVFIQNLDGPTLWDVHTLSKQFKFREIKIKEIKFEIK